VKFVISSLQSQVEKAGECWHWIGQVSERGPVIRHDGKTKLVARLICETQNRLEATQTVAQKCGNDLCVNPAHLFSCTRKEKLAFTELLHIVRKRSDEVGICWDWSGALQQRTFGPVMRYMERVQPVRRVLALAMQMDMELDGQPALATVKCENKLCVNPEHVITITRQQLQKRTAKSTQLHLNQARCRKLAQSARRRGKLTEAQVAEIRTIDGMKQRDIAALFNITQSTVSAIRRGAKWKDYANPYLQLIGMSRK
jgi:DNA-binding transcriptional regulator YiaG